MKIILALLGLLVLISSCKKDPPAFDYRDPITGSYTGIRIDLYFKDTIVGYGHDTSAVVLTLTKSEADSFLHLSFNPDYQSFTCKYENGQLIPTTYYHSPILTLSNDSLLLYHRPGLGNSWTECYTKKD